MSQRKHKKRSPKTKPKKTRRDTLRKFLKKNRDIINLLVFIFTFLGVLIAAATLGFAIYSSFSSTQSKPQIKPPPQFKIEQASPSIPVRLVKLPREEFEMRRGSC